MQASDPADAVQPERSPVPSADLGPNRPQPPPSGRAVVKDHYVWRIGLWALFPLAVLAAFAVELAAYNEATYRPYLFLSASTLPIATDDAALKRRVAAALPLGSTREQVESWLKAQGYPRSDIVDVASGKSVGIGCVMPYPNTVGLPGDIRIEFHFDKNDKLDDETVYIFIPSL